MCIRDRISGAEKPDALVIGADTIVALDNMILGKPKDEADALKMLQFLQGKTHQVYTGVCMMMADKTVSYTHLDVYKRQVFYLPFMRLI